MQKLCGNSLIFHVFLFIGWFFVTDTAQLRIDAEENGARYIIPAGITV